MDGRRRIGTRTVDTIMKRINLIWVALCATLPTCEAEPEPEGIPAACDPASWVAPSGHSRGWHFQAALDAAIDAGLPGIVMAIRDSEGTWQGAAGSADLGRGTPMEACHRTRVASVTKTFVAATVMTLVEDGVLELDAPITRYLPEERDRLPDADRITLRHLLSHTSGVYNYLDVAFALELFNRPSRTWTLKACYDHAMRGDPEFKPGTDWSYSNTNYILTGWIIEAVTGRAHEDVMQERIFDPLGMVSTHYEPDRFDFPGVVHGYFDLFGDHTLIDSTETYANTCVGPDGGMVSTAGDLLAFYEAVFARPSLLHPSSVQAMLPFVATGETDFPEYGLGLEAWVDGDAVAYGHGGHEFGYRTFAYYFPEHDVSFVVGINASSLLPTPDNISATIDEQRNRIRDIVLEGQASR